MQLLHMARADIDSVLKELGTHPDGLSEAEAHARLKQYGSNEIDRETHQLVLMRLMGNIKHHLVLLLLALSYAVLTQATKAWFIGRFGE